MHVGEHPVHVVAFHDNGVGKQREIGDLRTLHDLAAVVGGPLCQAGLQFLQSHLVGYLGRGERHVAIEVEVALFLDIVDETGLL